MSHTAKYPSPMISENIAAFSLTTVCSNIAAWFIVYFTPVSGMIHVMLFFLIVDTVAGIWASLKEGNKLESRKLRRTVMKFLWYTVSVMMAWMAERTFQMGWTKLATFTAGFICFVELKSIFENVTRITDEPVFRRILQLLKKKSTETLDEITDDQDDEPPRSKSHEK